MPILHRALEGSSLVFLVSGLINMSLGPKTDFEVVYLSYKKSSFEF